MMAMSIASGPVSVSTPLPVPANVILTGVSEKPQSSTQITTATKLPASINPLQNCPDKGHCLDDPCVPDNCYTGLLCKSNGKGNVCLQACVFSDTCDENFICLVGACVPDVSPRAPPGSVSLFLVTTHTSSTKHVDMSILPIPTSLLPASTTLVPVPTSLVPTSILTDRTWPTPTQTHTPSIPTTTASVLRTPPIESPTPTPTPPLYPSPTSHRTLVYLSIPFSILFAALVGAAIFVCLRRRKTAAQPPSQIQSAQDREMEEEQNYVFPGRIWHTDPAWFEDKGAWKRGYREYKQPGRGRSLVATLTLPEMEGMQRA